MSMRIEMLIEGRSIDGQRWDKKIRAIMAVTLDWGKIIVCVSPGPNPTVFMPVSEAGRD